MTSSKQHLWPYKNIYKRFSDVLLKSSSLLPHQKKDLTHITQFICNLHNQSLQHYVLGKNPTSVQNSIMLEQKKDTEPHIIEGLHSHDIGHKINSIASKQVNNKKSIAPFHACNSPHLVQDCNESICNWLRPDLDSHTPAKCISRRLPNRQQNTTPSCNHNNIRSQSNSHYDCSVQLSVTTGKPDHIAKLLEATKKMTKFF